MNESIIVLAIEALERRKEAIQSEIDAFRRGKQAVTRPPKWSPAAREAQRERMKAYWAKKKGAEKPAQSAKPNRAKAAKQKPRPQSAASRKAISERMKAYWAKRKAGKAKGSKTKV